MGFGRVLWKAIDGREFIIESDKLGLDTMEELNEYVAKLREEHGYEQPDMDKNNQISHLHIFNPDVEDRVRDYEGTIDTRDLPEKLREEVEEISREALDRPDPKTLN